MTTITPTLASIVLVSWWKPLLALLFLAGWAWVVSTVFDKDAQRYFLKRRLWNAIHLSVGAVAMVVFFSGLLPFAIALAIIFAMFAINLVAYFIYHNKHELVPAQAKWSMDVRKWFASAKAGKAKKSKQTKGLALTFRGPKGDIAAPERDTPEFELRLLAEELVGKMIESRAVQMEILPGKENTAGAMFTIDGVRSPVQQFTAQQAASLIDFFKAAAGLDLNDRRKRQQGEIRIGFGAGSGPLTPTRVTTIGGSAGQKLTLLIDPAKQVNIKLEDLGLLSSQQRDLKGIVEDGKGVVLVAAMPDNGRTTTLYALLRAHDAYTSNVQTVETDPQGVMEGVRQNVFDPQVDGAEYSTTVRSILRRDPDAVGVAEMPDENTAKEVARADHEHTRVYLGMGADNALSAIQIYCRAVGDQAKAAESLHGVVAQKLARRLCNNCRAPFQPAPDVLKKLGLPAEVKQLYRKTGQVLVKDRQQTCPMCGGTGYFGQIGIFAIHPIAKDERVLIAANDLTGLRNLFRQKKQPSVQSAALQHVVNGNTTIEELQRITQDDSAKKQAPAAPAPASKPA